MGITAFLIQIYLYQSSIIPKKKHIKKTIFFINFFKSEKSVKMTIFEKTKKQSKFKGFTLQILSKKAALLCYRVSQLIHSIIHKVFYINQKYY